MTHSIFGYTMKIKGYENYEVTTTGEVFNIKTGRVLKAGKNTNGYLQVQLCKNGKRKAFLVHRLVAEAFIPNPQNLPCINHKDETPLNNCMNNLEWCSYEYNNNYGTRTEKTAKIVLQLRKDGSLVRVWPSIHEVQRQFGFNCSHISQCCRGKRHTAYGFRWSYIPLHAPLSDE